jgi:molybdenum-dependent DNA-binding transcriptional regulator ModE
MDRLESMRIFLAVAEARSFAGAARQLRLSAPAVTRAVAALEAHLGARLLHRSTRLVRLTEVGERYQVDCRRLLAELDEAEAIASGAHVMPQSHLTVTAPVLFGRMHIAPLLLDFLQAHPQLTARAFFADRLVNLLDEDMDVAVRIAHLADSSLTAVRVGEVRRVIVASPDYLQRHGEVGIMAAKAGHGLARALSYQVADDVATGRLRAVLAPHRAAAHSCAARLPRGAPGRGQGPRLRGLRGDASAGSPSTQSATRLNRANRPTPWPRTARVMGRWV